MDSSEKCGAEGIRTPDFLLAKQALSRLSYSPSMLRLATQFVLRQAIIP